MNPKRAYLILLSAGLTELLLFLVISKSRPLLLWQSIEAFVLGEEYSLWPFLHGMLVIFLVLMSGSYLLFAKKGTEKESSEDLFQPNLLAEIDYGIEKVETETELKIQNKEIKIEKEIHPEEDISKKEKIDLDIKPPHTKKDHSPMFDIPPPGAPTKRPPDSKRKLL